MKLLKLKRLNSKGLSHHALIAVLVVSTIAGFGAYRVWKSSAAVSASAIVYVSNPDGCQLAGRIWVGGASGCKSKGDLTTAQKTNLTAYLCVGGAGEYKPTGTATVAGLGANTAAFCTAYVANSIDQGTCTNLGRTYIAGAGCAQYAVAENSSPRCWDPARPNYTKQAGADGCVAAAPVIDERPSTGDGGNSRSWSFSPPWKIYDTGQSLTSLNPVLNKGQTYRLCMLAKASSGTTKANIQVMGISKLVISKYESFGTTNKLVCTTSYAHPGGSSHPTIHKNDDAKTLLITSIYWR